MHSRPTASELVAAACEHLSERVIPTLADPQLRFQTLVAIHVLGIVEREIGLGEEPHWQEWTLLKALLGQQAVRPESLFQVTEELSELNRRLAEQISRGEWDNSPDMLHSTLR